MSLFHSLRLKLWLGASDGCCSYGSECCHCYNVAYPVTTDAATLSQTVSCLEAALGNKKHKSSTYCVFGL